MRDCYLLSARCYIHTNQQGHAKNCLKLILKVEPLDAQSIFLRGQANEIRPQTAQQALLDYQRAYELTLKSSNTSSSLSRALETRLTRIAGPSICSHIRKSVQRQGSGSQNSSRSTGAQELFEIDADGNSRSSKLIKMVTEPKRVKNAALILLVTFLATMFLLVRKRQLIKRVFYAAYRLFSRQKAVGAIAG